MISCSTLYQSLSSSRIIKILGYPHFFTFVNLYVLVQFIICYILVNGEPANSCISRIQESIQGTRGFTIRKLTLLN